MGYILMDDTGEVSTHGLYTGRCHWGGEYLWVIYWWMSLGR